MGEVFLAQQQGALGFQRMVVLKRLLPGADSSHELVARFIDEARLAAILNHPNVISTLEAGEWGGSAWLVMEYVPGWTCSQLMRDLRDHQLELPHRFAARIVCDAAVGLQYAHDAVGPDGRPLGVVHRDISPQNIMVRSDGVTKVLDFGVAFSATERQSRTRTGAVVGKLAYMPPEQLQGGGTNRHSDQYALGVVLWELLTGRRRFTGSTDLELIQRVLTEPTPHPSELNPEIPRALGDIALRMMDQLPERRFASCGSCAESLAPFASSQSGSFGDFLQPLLPVPAERAAPSKGDANVVALLQSMATPKVPEQDRTRVEPRRRWTVPVIVAVGLAAVAAAGLFAGFPTTSSQMSETTPVTVVAPQHPVQLAQTLDAGAAVIDPDGVPVIVAAVEPDAGLVASLIVAPHRVAAHKASKPKSSRLPNASPVTMVGRGRLNVSVEPASASVWLDGDLAGEPPLSTPVAAGKHVIGIVSSQSRHRFVHEVTVEPGQTLKLKFACAEESKWSCGVSAF
jgi:serine/threonine protein kinase